MSDFLIEFADTWKAYSIKHLTDLEKKCIEHAIRASVEIIDNNPPSIFDWERYIIDHPKLEQSLGKGSKVDVNVATCHYLNHGIREKRRAFKLGSNEPYVYDFDWKMYDKLNPDVYTQRERGDVIGRWHCFRHWCEIGHIEGRPTGNKCLVVKNNASISEDEDVNQQWRRKLIELIRPEYTKVDDLINYINKKKYNSASAIYNTTSAIYNTTSAIYNTTSAIYNTTSAIYNTTSATLDNTSTTLDSTSTTLDSTSTTLDNTSTTLDNTSTTLDSTSTTLDNTSTTFDSTLDIINNHNLTNIYKNIDDFSKFIEPYKNVLFICSDYPGYGGAATNCENLSKYYAKTHNVKSIYWTYSHEKDIINNNSDLYTIVSSSKIQSTLETLTFKPDVIILKNSLVCDLTKIFKCPTIFLIPGIYKNHLSVHYTELDSIEKQNTFINQSTLTQIRKSTYSFCNSSHTQDILKKWYKLDTHLFCSAFIPFYGETLLDDPNFHNRKYDYGLVVSDFNRKIKNVKKSIDSLKGKENVILIGKGSSKYNSHGFECVELVDIDKMTSYYKQIKYIVQDSHFESCSNVMVEAMFNGCKMKLKYSELNVVVSSTQYPGYGGAATNAYQIIKFLRQNGVNTAGVFFHETITNINYDPEEIGGIYLYNFRKYDKDKIRSDVKSYLKIEPNYCLAKNYRAPYICKEIFNCYTVYLVSGINHFSHYVTKSAEDILNPNFIIDKEIPEEIHCNTICDNIVLNSKLSYDIFNKLYPAFQNKIHPSIVDTTNCINIQPHISNNSKEYDIVIACSRLDRVDKNNLFLIDILKNSKFDKFKKLIIGNNYDKFKNIPNVQCVGLCDQITCIEYMAKSKVLLFPSLFDANSNTIREAIYYNCLPLITKNIGFYEAFPDFLICKSYTNDEWSSKLIYILENYDVLKDTRFNFGASENILGLIDSFDWRRLTPTIKI
jgi:glycosyltransferase involved in cell wall biosynthesis